MPHPPDAPLLSVVVPTYNRASVLPRALASLMAQEFDDFEVLVCDDGSDDDTRRVVEELGASSIRYLHQDNRGVSAARNLGIAHARGHAVTFLDSDDEAHPEWLALIAEHFADPAVGIVSVGLRMLRETGSGGTVGEKILLPRPTAQLLRQNRLRHALAGSLAARLDLLRAIGGYDERIAFSENSELVMRLVPACRARGLAIRSVERPLVVYHRRADARASDADSFARIRRGAERILEVHGETLRRRFPRGYANYHTVAAVNAGRLADVAAARRHLLAALHAEPTAWKCYLRLLLTLIPPVATRYWRRQAQRAVLDHP